MILIKLKVKQDTIRLFCFILNSQIEFNSWHFGKDKLICNTIINLIAKHNIYIKRNEFLWDK